MYSVRNNVSSKRLYTTPYRGQSYTPVAPTFCRVSRVFNERHLDITGFYCKHKHKIYRWRGKQAGPISPATVIGDSLVKWVRGVNFTQTQSIPGLNISKAIDRIKDLTLTVNRYQLIILMLATNDMQKYMPKAIVAKLADLIELIKKKNPTARIACNAIIQRPVDIPEQMAVIKARNTPLTAANYLPPPPPVMDQGRPPTRQQIHNALHPMEKKRRKTNQLIRKLCKDSGTYFLETWKAMENKPDRSINLNLFANDGLHLNHDGICALTKYIEGTTACLLDFKKLPKPKRWKNKYGLKKLPVIPPLKTWKNNQN